MSKSKYVDVPSIVQIIGNIYNNPKILDMDEKYFFNEEDFPEEFHKIIFGSIYNLHQLGAKEITIAAIEDYLEQRPKKLAVYKSFKGAEYLIHCAENVNASTFDYYYNRLKKMTLLRSYQETVGMDLSWLYDPDNIMDRKKKQLQEDWLDNTSLEQIADLIDDKITEVRMKYVDDSEVGGVQAGDGIDALLESLKETPEIGYPLYGPYVNTILRGARLKKFYLRSAATGVGKALPNSTIVPTPQGDKKVGDIKAGDYLFDAFGKPTLVKAIYPQGKKEVWEVEFKDGRKAKCCEEHLWSFCTEGQRLEYKKARKFQTKTLKEIQQMPLVKEGHGYNILVPMQKAVEYSEKEYYIKPYSFGLLLGDGSFRYSESNKALNYSSENEILPSYIAEEMGWNFKSCSDLNYNWVFEWKELNSNHTNVWVEEALKDYPVLWNVKSENKFIPNEYLEGSIAQRLDLLNGLLDSDGAVEKDNGRVSYWTISEKLKDGVVKLALSLGYKATVTKDNHKQSLCYKIEISGTPEDKVKLFKLPRKKILIESWYNNGKRKEHNLFNPIVAINKLDYSEEMTCFYVDNDEHLFLMNDYIVTHNTRAMVADACYIGCSQMFDKATEKWITTGKAEPVLYIATEQSLDEVQTMMIAFLSGVNEENILNGEYFAGEWERVQKAAQLLKQSKIYFEALPDFSLKDIENTIKRNVREHGLKYVFHDYLHTSMKILEEITKRSGGVRLREDNILFMISIRLKDLCNQYGIFIMTATQLNGDYISAKEYDQNLLRGAKSIADKIDAGLIMLEVSQEDLESLQPILHKGGFEPPQIKISVYKNRRGRWKSVLMWCRADRGCCRIEPMFVTKYNYELCEIEDLKIKVEDESIF